MLGNHGLCGLPEEGVHGKSPKCLGGNLGDFGEFCKGLLVIKKLHLVSWGDVQLLGCSSKFSDGLLDYAKDG
ncbi:hypothetical protein NEILACOT_03822 [Neisseria lactamica ATCC 23970]|uniref:Uncharacterized protein n=1 Tax=Neisseria lactamica ATCC 23970 TaxID=546265 RepID=D0W8G9_NEILA|nr:hypothetical protein NEILACOT_03822 [Neisseria lactamica ATCC 23970]